MPELLAQGETLQLAKADSWKAVRMLRQEAQLFEEPSDAMQLPEKLPAATLICILEQKEGWVRFEEPLEGGKMGWI